MRTTLTLDPDVANEVRKYATREEKAFKEAINELLRLGLRHRQSGEGKREPFRVRPHSFGLRPGIDPTKLNQVFDELEVEAYLEKETRIAKTDQ